MKVITYQNPETGRASIVSPSKSFIKSGRSLQELIDKLPAECQTTADIVDSSDIPEDRSFRDAWVTEKGVSVKTDITKAKELAKEVIRDKRKPVFEKLDLEVMRATESGKTSSLPEIVAKKEKARNATDDNRVTNSSSEAELKNALQEVVDEIAQL